jgi:hypothetical protein
MKRYSKPVYQGRRLWRMVELAEKSAEMPARGDFAPQAQRVTVGYHPRRSPNWYRRTDGASTPSYGDTMNSTRAASSALHEHSVAMRNQTGRCDVATTELCQAAQPGAARRAIQHCRMALGMGTKPRS